jgi:hypothetical protein
MSSFACPECRHSMSDPSQACIHCGWSRYRPTAATLSMSADVAAGVEVAAAVTFPLFPVATHKFIVLTICSFGIYELYWCYENWKRISDASREAISPFWRAVWAPLWGFSLFGRVRDLAVSESVVIRWNPTVLATSYLLLHGLAWRLPDTLWWMGMVAFVPILPVQRTVQRINHQRLNVVTEDPNNRYSGKNVALICVGGLLIVTALAGTFIPE